MDATEPLTLAARPAPRTWDLKTGTVTVTVASGRLSSGNSISPTGPIVSDTACCAAIMPAQAGSQPWMVSNSGLTKGGC